jgi:putative chitinase
MDALENGKELLLEAEINHPLRLAHFLAQIYHESGGLQFLREDMSYSGKRILEVFGAGKHSAAVRQHEVEKLEHNSRALAERVYGLGNPKKAEELGNTKAGDGYRYRGNGLMQLTGRANHRIIGQSCGVDFEGSPNLVTSAEHALKPAVYYWTLNRINALADRDDTEGVTRRINRGRMGLKERKQLKDLFLKALTENT